jgi:hypothetical protein
MLSLNTITSLLVGVNALLGQTDGGQSQRPIELCPEIATRMVLGVRRSTSIDLAPRVEIRRCGSSGGLQLAAWDAGKHRPDLLLDLYLTNVSRFVAAGNIVVLVAPGGYDLVMVLQYLKGHATVAFTDSTHGEISISTAENRLTTTIGPWADNPAKSRTFAVKEDELLPANTVPPK